MAPWFNSSTHQESERQCGLRLTGRCHEVISRWWNLHRPGSGWQGCSISRFTSPQTTCDECRPCGRRCSSDLLWFIQPGHCLYSQVGRKSIGFAPHDPNGEQPGHVWQEHYGTGATIVGHDRKSNGRLSMWSQSSGTDERMAHISDDLGELL